MGINGQHDYYHNRPNKPTNNFLPIFCRLSLDDIKHHPRRSEIRSAVAGDPGSPKVSCIGQVKRTNRVVGFPSTAAAHRHPRKPFSAKILLPNTALAAPTAGSRTCRPNLIRTTAVAVKPARSNCGDRVVDVGEMDPPLPVVKKAATGDEVSIWKRRGRKEGEMGRLKIEEIKLQGIINNGRFGFQESPTKT